MKLTTLCYPIRDGQVLLAMKKRGFGAGKWNGPGGKVQQGESVEEACRRETMEETGLDVTVEDRGIIEFIFDGKPDWANRCTVFVATVVSGMAVETEEMRPRWFALEDVPYDDMWEDDRVWLPGVFAGGRVMRRFFFDGDGRLLRHEPLS